MSLVEFLKQTRLTSILHSSFFILHFFLLLTMKRSIKRKIITALCLAVCCPALAQKQENGVTQAHYSGTTLADPYRHDGGLMPIIGVHNIQIMRALRNNGNAKGNILPWTYNHQPMLSYWKGRFWVNYLSDPVSEHVPPSVTYMQSSAEGKAWTAPEILFPEYPVPGWYAKPNDGKKSKEAPKPFDRTMLKAVMLSLIHI